MSERTRFVGLDVHEATVAVAVAEEVGVPESYGEVPNEPTALRKLVGRLGGQGIRLSVAYEAGPTGYALHRQLTGWGVECMVVALSLIPTRPGDRVKTDRRDALKLARLLRSGDLTPVWVPDREHEALRDLVRARADAKADELRAKHRLSKFLLRQGRDAPVGARAWSVRYQNWLNSLHFEHEADQVVFDDYRAVVRAAGERVRRLEGALQASAESPTIAALQAFRGVGFLSAATIVAEVGDFRRFATAPQFMAYTGLVPSEASSGPSHRRGRITKTGNSLLRHVLGEAAHHARHAPAVSAGLRQRQTTVPAQVVELSWRAQVRLHQRYRHLSGRIGTQKTIIAVARELAGFVWALGRQMEESSAE